MAPFPRPQRPKHPRHLADPRRPLEPLPPKETGEAGLRGSSKGHREVGVAGTEGVWFKDKSSNQG